MKERKKEKLKIVKYLRDVKFLVDYYFLLRILCLSLMIEIIGVNFIEVFENYSSFLLRFWE